MTAKNLDMDLAIFWESKKKLWVEGVGCFWGCGGEDGLENIFLFKICVCLSEYVHNPGLFVHLVYTGKLEVSVKHSDIPKIINTYQNIFRIAISWALAIDHLEIFPEKQNLIYSTSNCMSGEVLEVSGNSCKLNSAKPPGPAKWHSLATYVKLRFFSLN